MAVSKKKNWYNWQPYTSIYSLPTSHLSAPRPPHTYAPRETLAPFIGAINLVISHNAGFTISLNSYGLAFVNLIANLV